MPKPVAISSGHMCYWQSFGDTIIQTVFIVESTMMGEGAWCYYRYKRHCRKAQDRRMQSGSTAGFSRLQLYLYSGRRNLPSPVSWSQRDGASGGGLGCKEKLLEQHWKQLQQSADGSGFGQGQVCSTSAQGCALL